MTTFHADPARDYLLRLDRLTADLPAATRADLLASIEEHLVEADARGDLADALVRLGPVEDVSEAAHLSTPQPVPTGSGMWLVWVTAVVVAVAVAGFSVLGALLSVTAHFDEDADWNVSPLLVLLSLGAGVLAGLFASLVAAPSRIWRVRDKLAMTGLWIGGLLLAFAGPEAALLAPPGSVGFLVAGVVLLVGGFGVITAIVLATRAGQRVAVRDRARDDR